jgi:hypothetical protein
MEPHALLTGEWEVRTPHGKFRLKHSDNVVYLGGKDLCVHIKYDGPDMSELSWLGTKDARCELNDLKIKGKLTEYMLHVAISIFHKLYPDVTHLHLIDSSAYDCLLPDGGKRKLSMKETYFLFHGKTYYEDKFGAVPRTEAGLKSIETFRTALHDPVKKPAKFNFENPDLNEALSPLYKAANTWWEFFQAIQDKWGDKKCSIIYLWYRYALGAMSLDMIPEHWTIDIRGFPEITPTFKPMTLKGGGRRRRRVTRKNPHYYPLDMALEWSGGGTRFLDWKKVLKV